MMLFLMNAKRSLIVLDKDNVYEVLCSNGLNPNVVRIVFWQQSTWAKNNTISIDVLEPCDPIIAGHLTQLSI